jgi:uncharacterized integral membrane protein
MGRLLRLLIALVALIVLVAFLAQNRQPITLTFWPLPPTAQISLHWVILACAFAGAVIGGTIVWFNTLPRRIEARRNRRHLRTLQQEKEAAARAAEENKAAERQARRLALGRSEQTVLLPGASS